MLLEMWSKVGLGEKGMEINPKNKGTEYGANPATQVDRTWDKKGKNAAAGWKVQGRMT